MQHFKINLALGGRSTTPSIPVPYPFQTKQNILNANSPRITCGNQQGSVIVPDPPDQVRRQAAAGHVVSAAHVRQKLSQRRLGAAACIDPRQRQFQQRVSQRPLRGGGQHAGGHFTCSRHGELAQKCCRLQPRTARPPRCPPPLACNGELPPVPGYVSRRLRLAAAATALPAVRSAPGRGAPSRVNGDTP